MALGTYLLDTGVLLLYARGSAAGQAIEAWFRLSDSAFH